MQEAVRRFETEMTAVLVAQWRGCSWQVAEWGAWFLWCCRCVCVCSEVDGAVCWQARRSRRVCRPRAFGHERTWSPSPSPSAEATSRWAALRARAHVLLLHSIRLTVC